MEKNKPHRKLHEHYNKALSSEDEASEIRMCKAVFGYYDTKHKYPHSSSHQPQHSTTDFTRSESCCSDVGCIALCVWSCMWNVRRNTTLRVYSYFVVQCT